jgi:proteasome lid subunit RPN8/RPN11
MVFFKDKKRIKPDFQWKIRRKCLDLILESSKSTYPNEFGGLLRVDEEKKDTIIELVLLPGTVSGDSHAIFKLHMMPIDFSIVGTVHSHPSPSPRPSGADLQLFRKHGKVHIIAALPFDEDSWRAYNSSGEDINIIVL